jgi:hypothetical protein
MVQLGIWKKMLYSTQRTVGHLTYGRRPLPIRKESWGVRWFVALRD